MKFGAFLITCLSIRVVTTGPIPSPNEIVAAAKPAWSPVKHDISDWHPTNPLFKRTDGLHEPLLHQEAQPPKAEPAKPLVIWDEKHRDTQEFLETNKSKPVNSHRTGAWSDLICSALHRENCPHGHVRMKQWGKNHEWYASVVNMGPTAPNEKMTVYWNGTHERKPIPWWDIESKRRQWQGLSAPPLAVGSGPATGAKSGAE